MIAYKDLVKGHIYRTKPSIGNPCRIAYYVGKAKCILFKDCGDYGSSMMDTCDYVLNYVMEQDITEDYEFGLVEGHFPPPNDHTKCYRWKIQPRNYKGAGFFDLSHFVSHVRENFQYGISNISILKIGTFMLCDGKLHFSKEVLTLDTELKDILLGILIEAYRGGHRDGD